MKVVFATRNKGKLAEVQELLSPLHLDLVGLEQFTLGEIIESGSTFAENALIKAETACRHTGLASIADDSGLVVPALNGAPGIYSARYSGTDATDERNNLKLLEAMSQMSGKERQAVFCCCIAACRPDGQKICVEGFWPGEILTSPLGHNGFGYDPLFLDPELGMTAAQMDVAAKNKRSHRAKAIEKLIAIWPTFVNGR